MIQLFRKFGGPIKARYARNGADPEVWRQKMSFYRVPKWRYVDGLNGNVFKVAS